MWEERKSKELFKKYLYLVANKLKLVMKMMPKLVTGIYVHRLPPNKSDFITIVFKCFSFRVGEFFTCIIVLLWGQYICRAVFKGHLDLLLTKQTKYSKFNFIPHMSDVVTIFQDDLPCITLLFISNSHTVLL